MSPKTQTRPVNPQNRLQPKIWPPKPGRNRRVQTQPKSRNRAESPAAIVRRCIMRAKNERLSNSGHPTRIPADGRMGHRRGWRYNRGRDGGVLNRPFRAEIKGVAAASALAFLMIDILNLRTNASHRRSGLRPCSAAAITRIPTIARRVSAACSVCDCRHPHLLVAGRPRAVLRGHAAFHSVSTSGSVTIRKFDMLPLIERDTYRHADNDWSAAALRVRDNRWKRKVYGPSHGELDRWR